MTSTPSPHPLLKVTMTLSIPNSVWRCPLRSIIWNPTCSRSITLWKIPHQHTGYTLQQHQKRPWSGNLLNTQPRSRERAKNCLKDTHREQAFNYVFIYSTSTGSWAGPGAKLTASPRFLSPILGLRFSHLHSSSDSTQCTTHNAQCLNLDQLS